MSPLCCSVRRGVIAVIFMLCNDGYTPLLSLFPCHCSSFKGDSSEAAASVCINKPGANQHASASLLGRLLQKRNVSLQTVQMLSNAWEWGRRAVWGQTNVNRDGDKKWAEWGKKDKTRGGIKGSALMQSRAHLSSAGGQRPAALQLHCHFRQRHGEAGLLRPLHRAEWVQTCF